MKIKYLITGCIFILFMGGCSSTQNLSNDKKQHITVPEAYQVMADFGIISQYDANQMAKTGKMALAKNINNFNSSVAGQLTNNGSMLAGFAIAQLFGGGVSLSSFFNPSLAFRSTAHKNKLTKPYLFIPVDDLCDEVCAENKLIEITHTIAKYYAENYARQIARMENRAYEPLRVGKAEEVKYEFGKGVTTLWGSPSKSYDANISGLTKKHEKVLNDKTILSKANADFFRINGQRFYGSRISTVDNFRIALGLRGWPEQNVRDNSLVLGMVKASEEHDFIYIETLRGFPKTPDGRYTSGHGEFVNSIGDFMIKGGKYIQLGIYTHPDNQLKDLDKMNHLGVQIKHALDDLVPEVLEEAGSSSNEIKMTASSELNQGN